MPLARNTDPHTSHEAGLVHEVTGRATCNRELVRALVEQYPGHTSRELSVKMAAKWLLRDRYEIARRLSDLEHMRLVSKGPARACRIGGRSAVVWYPVD